MSVASMAIETVRHRFTVHEFTLMHEVGIFAEDQRLELLDGEIYEMSPIGPLHLNVVNRIAHLMWEKAGKSSVVSVQNPVRLSSNSMPQPEITLLDNRVDQNATALPTPADALLLIEVSHTSLKFDREVKLPHYAAAGVPEVWIVDIEHRTIEQYTHPQNDQYGQYKRHQQKDRIQATQLPGVEFELKQIFPNPATSANGGT